jgi:hypothetical protein
MSEVSMINVYYYKEKINSFETIKAPLETLKIALNPGDLL